MEVKRQGRRVATGRGGGGGGGGESRIGGRSRGIVVACG